MSRISFPGCDCCALVTCSSGREPFSDRIPRAGSHEGSAGAPFSTPQKTVLGVGRGHLRSAEAPVSRVRSGWVRQGGFVPSSGQRVLGKRAVDAHLLGHTLLAAAMNKAVSESAPRYGPIAGQFNRGWGQSTHGRFCSVQYANTCFVCCFETCKFWQHPGGSRAASQLPEGKRLLSGQAPTPLHSCWSWMGLCCQR